ncbi:MAG TPA: PilZ domain-containing protein [Solirubrobacteraceae bacterium]|nr:PilZ domain-containing protein [Solirubrobacteraceae bacterium]
MTSEPEPKDNVVRLNVGGKDGKLTTSVGSHIPVRVYERSGDYLMLVLMLDAGDELSQDVVEPLLLEYVSPRGLVRFHGQAVVQERDLVRFDVSAAAEVTQRREFVRVPAAQKVEVAKGHDSRAGVDRIDAHAIDISGGGMLLSGAEGLPLGTHVRFSLNLGAGVKPIEGNAQVVRAGDEGKRALVFDQISRGDRQRLIHFVFERQREALAKIGRVIDHRSAG